MTQEKWITYARPHWSRGCGELIVTRMESEGPPRLQNYTPRPATAEEIAKEKAHRKASAEAAAEQETLMKRPEYQHAGQICNVLQVITKELLDRLSPEEWAELERKLRA